MTDLDAVARLVRQVAAQVHVPLFRQGVAGEEKSPGEVVSRVDREAERLLIDGLADITPGLPVIGEEAASEDPSMFQALRGDRSVWLVDPLDGTHAAQDKPAPWRFTTPSILTLPLRMLARYAKGGAMSTGAARHLRSE